MITGIARTTVLYMILSILVGPQLVADPPNYLDQPNDATIIGSSNDSLQKSEDMSGEGASKTGSKISIPLDSSPENSLRDKEVSDTNTTIGRIAKYDGVGPVSTQPQSSPFIIGNFWILFFTLVLTGIIAWASYRSSENSTRPMLSSVLLGKSSLTRIHLRVLNVSNTDADGIVIVRLFDDKGSISFDSSSYNEEWLWYFPVALSVSGNKSLLISEDLNDVKADESASEAKKELEFETRLTEDRIRGTLFLDVFVHYRRWFANRKVFKRGRMYAIPPKRYEYKKSKWIPVLTFKTPIKCPDINFKVLRQRG